MINCLFYNVFMLGCYLIFKKLLMSESYCYVFEMLSCEVKEIEVRLICI